MQPRRWLCAQPPRGPPCLGQGKQRLTVKESRGEVPMPSSTPPVGGGRRGSRDPGRQPEVAVRPGPPLRPLSEQQP